MKRFTLVLAALLISGSCFAGVWGPGSFDNDDALDWVQLCTASKGGAAILSALQSAMRPGALEAPEGAAAVAAAELVAAAKGKPSKTLPKELSDWLKLQPKQEIAKFAPVATKALVRVRNPEVSELRQVWDESASKQWINTVTELETRLK